jgi:hypothetical protein
MEDVDMFYGPFANVLSIWYILWPFGIFYGHLVYFMAIWYWYHFPSLGIFFTPLVSCTKKNLATLPKSSKHFRVNVALISLSSEP